MIDFPAHCSYISLLFDHKVKDQSKFISHSDMNCTKNQLLGYLWMIMWLLEQKGTCPYSCRGVGISSTNRFRVNEEVQCSRVLQRLSSCSTPIKSQLNWTLNSHLCLWKSLLCHVLGYSSGLKNQVHKNV